MYILQTRATSTTCMHDAQLDEASIMQHTGHGSVNGVHAYKRHTEKLEELTSAVLNGTSNVRPMIEERASVKEVQGAKEEKENKEKVCPNLPTLPWNFEEALDFKQLL